jgi:NAD(P)-dependent dehydrogenase (short-subunit alcohol dehydrogenase family)
MDVGHAASVQAGVDYIVAEAGRIDVVVCNAGFGLAGSVEDCTVDEVRQQFETNFFGTWRVCRTVLPRLRQKAGRHLVIVSSLAGLMGVPYQAAYSASKFALEGMAEALRMEVRPWGLNVVLVEPGDFRTGFTRSRVKARGADMHSDYAETFARALSVMERDEQNGPAPEKVAALVEKIIRHPNPRLRYTVGPMLQRLGALLKRILPGRVFEWLMRQTYKLV